MIKRSGKSHLNGSALKHLAQRVVVFPAMIPPVEGRFVYFMTTLRRVVSILRDASVFAVPFSPPHLRGITQWQAQVLPVIRLEESLGLKDSWDYATRCLMLIRLANTDRLAMIQCGEGVRILPPPERCEPVSDADWIGSQQFLRGLYCTEDEFYIFADMERLMQAERPSDEALPYGATPDI